MDFFKLRVAGFFPLSGLAVVLLAGFFAVVRLAAEVFFFVGALFAGTAFLAVAFRLAATLFVFAADRDFTGGRLPAAVFFFVVAAALEGFFAATDFLVEDLTARLLEDFFAGLGAVFARETFFLVLDAVALEVERLDVARFGDALRAVFLAETVFVARFLGLKTRIPVGLGGLCPGW